MQLAPLPQSPRTLHRLIVVRAIVSSLMLGGCVEATAYEQATSAAEVQAEGRRRASEDLDRTAADLRALRKENERLKAENVRLESELAERQGTVDQVELDLVLAKQEHRESASLVQQLRGDLARVGTHLEAFSDEKAGLGSELAAARAENERLSKELAEVEATAAPDQTVAEPAKASLTPAELAPDGAGPVDGPRAAAPAPPSPSSVSE